MIDSIRLELVVLHVWNTLFKRMNSRYLQYSFSCISIYHPFCYLINAILFLTIQSVTPKGIRSHRDIIRQDSVAQNFCANRMDSQIYLNYPEVPPKISNTNSDWHLAL